MNWAASKKRILNSSLIKNSFWGIASNIFQVLFVTLFFVIIARKYDAGIFAEFLIATTVYQLVSAFSSMGLGQWFIRRYEAEKDKLNFTSKFIKTQIGLGFLFYFANIILAYALYPDGNIRLLCVLLGTNIVFDNLILALKSLNIAEFRQKKTAVLLVIDGFLKLLVGCLLFIYPFSAVMLAVFLIVVRVLTLGLFIKIGTDNNISIKYILKASIAYRDLKELVLANWQFMVIGSISIIYWRVGNIIISKALSLQDVANYEIAFRVFSVLQILPVVASATVYPQFIKLYNEHNMAGLKRFYKNVFAIYTVFSIISYAFVFSFAPILVPLAFGDGYPGAAECMQQMFLTFLLLPTVLLQANLIVAIGLEKKDMIFNLIGFVINVACCFIGLYFYKSILIVNLSILVSFLVFHVLQDILLVRRKITTISHALLYYPVITAVISFYHFMARSTNPYSLFILFAIALVCIPLAYLVLNKRGWRTSFITEALISK